MPVLQAYPTQPGAIDVLGVNVRDQPSDALALASAVGVRYPSVTDPGDAVQAAIDAPPALPSTWVAHPDGSAERITDPLVFHVPDQVRNAVNRALRGS